MRYTIPAYCRGVLMGAGALLLAACGTAQIGRDFDVKSFESRVERGVTTKEQVRDVAGRTEQYRHRRERGRRAQR